MPKELNWKNPRGLQQTRRPKRGPGLGAAMVPLASPRQTRKDLHVAGIRYDPHSPEQRHKRELQRTGSVAPVTLPKLKFMEGEG